MSELRNEFSWSKTRNEVFKTCPRQYWFACYGYWSGWLEDAPERTRQIYMLKNYLSGPGFGQRVEAIVGAFVSMKNDLDQEKRAINKIWSKRERQIERVITNISGMYGDMQGIIGASLPQIKSLELKALIEDSGSDDLEGDKDEIPF